MKLPENGATPVGKLCVSAVNIGCNIVERVVIEDGAVGSTGLKYGTSNP